MVPRARDELSSDGPDERTMGFVLLSTSVVPGFRQRGIATELIGHVLDDVRGFGSSLTIICPAVREFVDHYRQ